MGPTLRGSMLAKVGSQGQIVGPRVQEAPSAGLDLLRSKSKGGREGHRAFQGSLLWTFCL